MNAISTWPADDLILTLEGTRLVLYEDPDKSAYVHGCVTMGSIAMTCDEAEELINKLRLAINETKRIDQQYIDHCREEEKKGNISDEELSFPAVKCITHK